MAGAGAVDHDGDCPLSGLEGSDSRDADCHDSDVGHCLAMTGLWPVRSAQVDGASPATEMGLGERDGRMRGTELLPHYPLRGSLPRWGKHSAETEAGVDSPGG